MLFFPAVTSHREFVSLFSYTSFYQDLRIWIQKKEYLTETTISKQNVLFNYVEIDQNYITDSSWSGEKKNDKIKPW